MEQRLQMRVMRLLELKIGKGLVLPEVLAFRGAWNTILSQGRLYATVSLTSPYPSNTLQHLLVFPTLFVKSKESLVGAQRHHVAHEQSVL